MRKPALPQLSARQLLQYPGVSGCADLAIGYARRMEISAWRRMVLDQEGLAGWRAVPTVAGSYCWHDKKMIQLISDEPAVFLHEVAHALHTEPEGEHKNHYHGGGWADQFSQLVEKYMVRRL